MEDELKQFWTTKTMIETVFGLLFITAIITLLQDKLFGIIVSLIYLLWRIADVIYIKKMYREYTFLEEK